MSRRRPPVLGPLDPRHYSSRRGLIGPEGPRSYREAWEQTSTMSGDELLETIFTDERMRGSWPRSVLEAAQGATDAQARRDAGVRKDPPPLPEPEPSAPSLAREADEQHAELVARILVEQLRLR